jgi:uncharacterized protein YggE
MNKSSIVVVIVIVAQCEASNAARAQYFPGGGSTPAGNIEGFVVTGKGTVSAKPNRLEIDMEVSASSELSADAIVKYRDAKKRLQEAFTTLKLANVSVEERGLKVDEKGSDYNPYMWGYEPNKRNKTEVQLTRKLVVKCSGIRKLNEEAMLQLVAKLLDVAQDAGGKVGPQNNMRRYWYYDEFNNTQGLIRFILDDFDQLEEEAYAKALADAQTKARRLAKLSRATLGAVTAVREVLSPSDRFSRQDDEPSHEAKRLEASRFQEIPVKVELVVRFDAKADPAPAGRPANP